MPVTINAITPRVGLEIIGMTADQLVEPHTAAEAQCALDVAIHKAYVNGL